MYFEAPAVGRTLKRKVPEKDVGVSSAEVRYLMWVGYENKSVRPVYEMCIDVLGASSAE